MLSDIDTDVKIGGGSIQILYFSKSTNKGTYFVTYKTMYTMYGNIIRKMYLRY